MRLISSGQAIPAGSIEYETFDALDLTRANMTRENVGSEVGYRLTGDQKSYVDNFFNPDLDFRPHGSSSSGKACTYNSTFAWYFIRLKPQHCQARERFLVGLLTFVCAHRSTSTPFNYTVFFSNVSASATFYLENSKGAITLQFNGSRADHHNDQDALYQTRHRSATIELNATDSSNPGFEWSNGDHIMLRGQQVAQQFKTAGQMNRIWRQVLTGRLMIALASYLSL